MKALLNPYLILLIVAGWSASLAGTAVYFTGVGEDNIIAFNAKAEQVVRDTREAAQQGAATAIAANRPKNIVNVQEVRREIEEKVVYRECVNTPNVLRGINTSLTGVRPDPAGGLKLPGTDATKRFELRGNGEQTDRSSQPVP